MSLAAGSWTKLHFHDSVPGFKCSPVGIRAQPKSRMKLVGWCASTASLAVWSQLLTPCCMCVCCNDAHMILPKLCLSAGFHDAADHAEGERSSQIPGFLHQNPRHDVGVWRRSRCSVTIASKQELTCCFFFLVPTDCCKNLTSPPCVSPFSSWATRTRRRFQQT